MYRSNRTVSSKIYSKKPKIPVKKFEQSQLLNSNSANILYCHNRVITPKTTSLEEIANKAWKITLKSKRQSSIQLWKTGKTKRSFPKCRDRTAQNWKSKHQNPQIPVNLNNYITKIKLIEHFLASKTIKKGKSYLEGDENDYAGEVLLKKTWILWTAEMKNERV